MFETKKGPLSFRSEFGVQVSLYSKVREGRELPGRDPEAVKSHTENYSFPLTHSKGLLRDWLLAST